jgi:hypothetical protein
MVVPVSLKAWIEVSRNSRRARASSPPAGSSRRSSSGINEIPCHLFVPRREEVAVELDHLAGLEERGQDLVFGDEAYLALDLDGPQVRV